MNVYRNINARTHFEPLFALILAAALAVLVYIVIFAASNAQRAIIAGKSDQTLARTAVSYISAKIRKNDAEGGISVKMIDGMGIPAIVIIDSQSSGIYWIYEENGYIVEYDAESPEDEPYALAGVAVAPADDFTVSYNNNSITYMIKYDSAKFKESLTTTVYVKTGVTGYNDTNVNTEN